MPPSDYSLSKLIRAKRRKKRGKRGQKGGREVGRGGKEYLSSVLVEVEHEALGVVPAGGTHLLPPALMALDAIPGVTDVLLHPPRALVAPVAAALAPPGG